MALQLSVKASLELFSAFKDNCKLHFKKMSAFNIYIHAFQVKSLFTLCIDCIKTSLVNSHFATNHEDFFRSQTGIKNPFPQLPTSVLEEVTRSITDCNEKLKTRNYILYYLMTSAQIHNMWFAFYSFDDSVLLAPYFGKLRSLNLRNSGADNYCLIRIGKYCNELRSLDVSGCNCVSDEGIKWLFAPEVVDFQIEKVKLHRISKTLKQLNIHHTSVSSHGIVIALQCSPSLTIIENLNTFEALVNFADPPKKRNYSEGLNEYLSLSILNIPYGKIYRSDSLRLVLPLCRSISHVIVHAIKGFTDSDLLCLKSIKQLIVLKILRCPKSRMKDQIEITFDGGVAPLLQTVGKSLEILDILHLDSFRVSTIIECCTYLINLSIGEKFGGSSRSSVIESESLSLFLSRIEGKEKQQLILKDLKTFFCSYNMPSDMLDFLLSSPLLAHIKITNCNTFTDSILKNAVEHNQFKNLELLELAHCNSVSTLGMLTLLTDHSPKIKIDSCSKLTLEICSRMCQEIAVHNNVSEKFTVKIST